MLTCQKMKISQFYTSLFQLVRLQNNKTSYLTMTLTIEYYLALNNFISEKCRQALTLFLPFTSAMENISTTFASCEVTHGPQKCASYNISCMSNPMVSMGEQRQ